MILSNFAYLFTGFYVLYMIISIIITIYDLFIKDVYKDYDNIIFRLQDSGAFIIMIIINAIILICFVSFKIGEYLI